VADQGRNKTFDNRVPNTCILNSHKIHILTSRHHLFLLSIMAPEKPEKERAKPQNRVHHLIQQEKLAAAVLYLKGNWEAHELARQMRVSTGAISRVVKESQKSAGDDDSLAGLLAARF
jgi:hypothetical protein